MSILRSCWSTACSIVFTLVGCSCLFSCSGDERPKTNQSHNSNRPTPQVTAEIRKFCGDCHAFPSPDSFSRADWPREVEQGYEFYYLSLRTDLAVPPMQETIDFYVRQAPEDLPAYKSRFSTSQGAPVRFHLLSMKTASSVMGDVPAVAHVKWGRLNSETYGVFTCDMRSGIVAWASAGIGKEAEVRVLCKLDNPCHIEPTDLDGDGHRDFVIADLGSFLPEDHHKGRLLWLHADPTGENWQTEILAEGLGRVCDARAADFNQDGKIDLIVAEFGWRQTGRTLLFENEGQTDGVPDFRMKVLDDRHGAIHVPVADLDSDGRPDFIVLFAQEHETIEAFLNKGDGTFERRKIFSADNPSFGSSGIQLVDMDQDGDMDVLHTNGDSFDSAMAKPYHGIRWLENTGTFPFKEHNLAQLPGVHRALVGDLDGDGDLDVVAVSLLPPDVLDARPPKTFDSVIWLEQVVPGKFVGHAIAKGACNHATCELADWNNDGQLDIIVGEFHWGDEKSAPLSWYQNRRAGTQ